MDLDATIDGIADAPHDAGALRALITDDVVDGLLGAARAAGDDEERQGRLLDALERTSWLFAEEERLAPRPAPRGKGSAPTASGPRNPRWEEVVVAAVTLRASLAATSEDGMEQSALNTAVRGLKTFPANEALAALARRIFVGYGERTSERLSLDEAYFPFSPDEPPSPLAAELRASLEAQAEAAGWVAP